MPKKDNLKLTHRKPYPVRLEPAKQGENNIMTRQA